MVATTRIDEAKRQVILTELDRAIMAILRVTVYRFEHKCPINQSECMDCEAWLEDIDHLEYQRARAKDLLGWDQ